MTISLKLTDSIKSIEKKVFKAIVEEANTSLFKSTAKIIEPIKMIVINALESSPEISSLNNGTLRADFGIPAGKDVTTPIVRSIANSVFISKTKFSVSGNKISGGITIGVQPISYANLSGLGITPLEKGGSLPWLDWLINLGDSIIISDFGVDYGPFGRSGQARMSVKSRPFKVDSNFSGTPEDNFITRSLDKRASEIASIIKRSL
tara:strand:- start:6760 stop:7377 length:618 start_codon:yes stop_codon:yes gene_type:complete